MTKIDEIAARVDALSKRFDVMCDAESKIAGIELLNAVAAIAKGHADVINNKVISKEGDYWYVEGGKNKPMGLYEAARKLGYKG